MATRNRWETLYGVGPTVTSISTAADAIFGIPLLNQPSFSPGTQIINNRKAVGTSYKQTGACKEFQQGVAIPSTSWEFNVSASNIGYFLWSLFQSTAHESATTPYPKYFFPYETATTEMWLTLVRKLAPAGTPSSHRIVGAVVNSITLSAEEGQMLKATVEFQGYSFESNRDVGTADAFTFSTAACLPYSSAVITLGGHTVNLPGFSITITNNALTKFYDNATAVRHDLGELVVTGSFQMPYAAADEGSNVQLDAFINGTASRLVIYWGNGEIADADTELSIITHIRRTDASMTGEDEILTEVSFEGASEDYSSSVTTASASTIGVATNGVVTGTNTKFNNFHVGDLLYPFGCGATAGRNVRVITSITNDTSMTVFPVFGAAESGKLYKILSTPITISLADATNFITGI